MLPSVSLNHTALAPPAVEMPFSSQTFFKLGREVFSEIHRRPTHASLAKPPGDRSIRVSPGGGARTALGLSRLSSRWWLPFRDWRPSQHASSNCGGESYALGIARLNSVPEPRGRRSRRESGRDIPRGRLS